MTTSQATSQAPKGFFRLPAELRNHIYDLVLGDTDNSPAYVPWQTVLKTQPGLTQASRQLREETLSICYGLVTPVVDCTNDAMESFESILKQDFSQGLLQHTQRLGFVFVCGTERSSGNRFEDPHHTLLLLEKPIHLPWKVTLKHGNLSGKPFHRERIGWEIEPPKFKLYGIHVQQFCMKTGADWTDL
ncbi:hypothetical protein LTR56_000660 [Elasticomyces elasticus]|nr:hypothetical protein LTR56_000660 [Elasticomyces elasticus]KAK4919440.1 hypothetical protein LTR49_012974 [Elasticomyces elasticus]